MKPETTQEKVIRLLQKDSQLSNKDLAQKLHMTEAGIKEVVTQLEKEGVPAKAILKAMGAGN